MKKVLNEYIEKIVVMDSIVIVDTTFGPHRWIVEFNVVEFDVTPDAGIIDLLTFASGMIDGRLTVKQFEDL